MSEAEALRKAIEWARQAEAGTGHPFLAPLADAAEKHLATLPRKVTVTSWVLVGRLSHIAYSVHATREAAEAANPDGVYQMVKMTGEYEEPGR